MLKTLKSKFIFTFIVIEIVFLLVIASVSLSSLSKSSTSLLMAKIEKTTGLFSQLITTPLAIADLATLDDAVGKLAESQDIEAVRVENSEGLVVSSFLKTKVLSENLLDQMRLENKAEYEDRSRYFYLSHQTINYEEEVLGKLFIVFDNSSIKAEIKNSYLITMGVILLFLIISFLIVNFIGNQLGTSLEYVAKIAQSVARDEHFEITTNTKEIKEIRSLHESMRQMQESIAQRTFRLNQTLSTLRQFVHAMDASAIVLKTDLKGIITFANAKFCEISGFSEDELIGESHKIIAHPDTVDETYVELWETLLKKGTYHHTLKNRSKSGEAFYVDITILPLFDTQEQIEEFIAISYDVTDLVESKNLALAAERSKDIFLSNMSHEIRTPLNAILGFVHLLEKEIKTEKAQSYLDVIEGSSETLLHVINDILDFSKIQSGKLEIDKHSFNPNLEIALASKLFTPIAQEKSITFTTLIDPKMPHMIDGDLIRIKQIMFNFLSNAFKFTPEGRSVILVAEIVDEQLHISVEDSGVGIEADKLDKIFKPFEQEDSSTTRKFGGTGLGLSISWELSRLMGGQLNVGSQKGRGSTFSLSIPTVIEQEYVKPSMDFTNVNVGLFESKENELFNRSVKYYLDNLAISYEVKETFEAEDSFDMFIFVPNGKTENWIRKEAKRGIAIEALETNDFIDDENITSFKMPFSSQELLAILENEFGNTPKDDAESKVQKIFKGKILIVEDNTTNQMLIKILLDEYGIDYDVANDGVEALTMYKESSYDLVLMDENMPNKNGLEAFADIRQYELENQKENTPVIALTANALAQDKKRFFEAGMEGFLSKPINITELESVLERFLHQID